MPTFTTSDGTTIHYKDQGEGPTLLFSHGWPLASEAWDAQLLFFGQRGYRVIAHDRRSHGRSDHTWDGNVMDRYADDLGELMAHLDLQKVVMVGHSTGGGEVAHTIARHGNERVAGAVLVSAVPPLMLQTADNPKGTPKQVFDDIRAGVASDRSQFYLDLTMPFYGFNREGATVSEGLRQSFWLMGMQGGIKGQYDCIAEFSEVDYTDDLKAITVPTLVVHGDDDQIVPIDASGRMSAEIVRNAELKVYEGASHGHAQVQPDRFNADLLAFVQKVGL
ncbi:alpha/beta fold hydrolase [Acuticoccus mangrovi]|uniref:Alpha/beta hydrolase n=1 Tax=Acuticoccus mangrovi TaxID=2796142 RepID=A0A934ISS4_9HYPH|nr:alpha/beta hydrolase [Acuticoccus mangrovi]MBJ3777009.1 alpha/beta hydrolase [Acuticoccus mangrovi]